MRLLALPLLLGLCAPDETISGYADPEAVWRLDTLHDAPFAAEATLRFPAEGEVTGAGPCNGFTATQTLPYPWIGIGPIRATRRACPALGEEARYFDALQAATLIEVSERVLILTDEAGRESVFTRVE